MAWPRRTSCTSNTLWSSTHGRAANDSFNGHDAARVQSRAAALWPSPSHGTTALCDAKWLSRLARSLAYRASAARWLRRALPSPPSACAVRVLDAGALCAGVSRFGGSVASACFAVAAFSSRGARARRWCSLCWRKSLRRLDGFGVLCRRRLQLARCACSTLVLSGLRWLLR